MTQTFAATVAALIAPLKEAEKTLENGYEELNAYDHPLYSGPCLEIMEARSFVNTSLSQLSLALAALDNLQSRLVAGDPPRENVGTAGDEPPLIAAE